MERSVTSLTADVTSLLLAWLGLRNIPREPPPFYHNDTEYFPINETVEKCRIVILWSNI